MEKLIKGANATTEEIARKVNEIVEWIDTKEPSPDDFDGTAGDKCKKHERLFCDECQETTEEPSATEYPDFKKWAENAITTRVLDGTKDATAYTDENDWLKFAPEDFYIEKGGGRQYLFTWDEAMKLEEEVLKPNGWRLPTCEELAQLCATYIDDDGADDTERFMKELNVKMRGYKTPNGNISNVGGRGSWWSATAYSSAYARNLDFVSGYFYPQSSGNKGDGFAVRPVRTDK